MKIAGYCRISVDEELDNTSIKNQKEIIKNYVLNKFPNSTLEFFEDRDKSGYTFLEREGYQKLRKKLFENKFDILIVKDFSRFSRRNSLGLYELETLRDAEIRIISIGDNVDFPENDDWLSIQFRFLMNEMPVTDTSKKVRNVVKMRQQKGEWICNAPYGYYIHPLYKNKIFVDDEGAKVVKLIFKLYNDGMGYKKIAEHLTQNNCPTAISLMIKQIKERGGDTTKLEARKNEVWSHISVSNIIKNDFYIGVLRQNMWSRKGINKKDKRIDEEKHIVFENHHEPIIDEEVFKIAKENLKHRSVSHYNGIRKYENSYSGYLFCDDCKSPMFAISNPKRPVGYVCGNYHKWGLKSCTSHHIHEKEIDKNVRSYIYAIKNNLSEKIVKLDNIKPFENKNEINLIKEKVEILKLELKESNKQRIKQIIKKSDEEDIINETFDEMEKDIISEIRRLENKNEFMINDSKKRAELKNNIDGVLKIFDELLKKEHFSKQDISKIIDKITIDNEKLITIELKSDITELFDLI